jgi:hypothetical protein
MDQPWPKASAPAARSAPMPLMKKRSCRFEELMAMMPGGLAERPAMTWMRTGWSETTSL